MEIQSFEIDEIVILLTIREGQEMRIQISHTFLSHVYPVIIVLSGQILSSEIATT